ncbi:MAG: hypothetical protein L3J52_03375 [Proteobacteria bacterium]|nr:hypothetical protein [Pseudomonadota bacterium]
MKIELTVAYVGFGGNIGDGEYFYSYSPNVVMVKAKDEVLNFVFSDATAENFAMTEILTTDANNQFETPTKTPGDRSMQVKDINSNAQLTFLSVLVHDKTRNKLISCDPQVLNIPD